MNSTFRYESEGRLLEGDPILDADEYNIVELTLSNQEPLFLDKSTKENEEMYDVSIEIWYTAIISVEEAKKLIEKAISLNFVQTR